MLRSSNAMRRCWQGGTRSCWNVAEARWLVIRSGLELKRAWLRMISANASIWVAATAWCCAIPVVDIRYRDTTLCGHSKGASECLLMVTADKSPEERNSCLLYTSDAADE